MSSFPQTLGIQNQRQAHALVKALVTSKFLSKWRAIWGKTPLEINGVLLSFSYGVAGQCYDEIQIQRYVNLVERMGYEKTKLAAQTKIGSVYCMPIDAVAYRRINPKRTEHLTVFVSEGVKPDGTFSVCTITHTPLQSTSNVTVGPRDYAGVSSLSYIPCDRKYQYSVSINELFDRVHRRGRYASLPLKEHARMVAPFQTFQLNKLLTALSKNGNIQVPLCIRDGGVGYGLKQEILASTILPEELTRTQLFELRFDKTSIEARTQAREFLETLYKQAGTPNKFIETYKDYADLPLSYARYKAGIDISKTNLKECMSDLCTYLKVPKKNSEFLTNCVTQSSNAIDPLTLVEYNRTSIPYAFDFYTLQIQNNGALPNLRDLSEKGKLQYLLGSCPKDVDSSLYLKQFVGRDVLLDYQNAKPITDPKLLELYGQFPVAEVSQISLQNVNNFLTYLKDNELSAQDFGQITAEMVKNLTTPGTICKERGIAEYLKLNTVTDANSLEHVEEISHHIGKTIDNGLDCVMHKGDTLASLMPPLNPINVIGNFIDL